MTNTIIKGFSLSIQRGDRVAFVGPTGWQTTVLKCYGEDAPDQGEVKQGTNLVPAVFDQIREQLDPERSLWENLTSDPAMGVSGKADHARAGTPNMWWGI